MLEAVPKFPAGLYLFVAGCDAEAARGRAPIAELKRWWGALAPYGKVPTEERLSTGNEGRNVVLWPAPRAVS